MTYIVLIANRIETEEGDPDRHGLEVLRIATLQLTHLVILWPHVFGLCHLLVDALSSVEFAFDLLLMRHGTRKN